MRELISLGLPVVLTYLGINLMGFVDILVVGQVNSVAIGAVGIGGSFFAWFLVFGLGLSSGMEYLVAHAHGARHEEKKLEYLIQGSFLAIGVAIPSTLILVLLSHHLHWFKVHQEVLGPATRFTSVVALSLLPSLVFNVFRLYLTASGIVRPAMMILIGANIINAFADYGLVLGKWGLPRFEAQGAAYATLVSRVFMMVMLGFWIPWPKKIRMMPHRLKALFKLGWPAALQLTFEVGVFAIATALAARLSPTDLAAHQIVLSIASFTFMVPLGVGSATAVLVGQALGRNAPREATHNGDNGFIVGVGFMALSCLTLLLFATPILHIFAKEGEVVTVARDILVVAALFQLSDGVQVVGTGALRGLGDTRSAMVFNLCGHWLVGLPTGILLGFYWGWGLKGIWIGLSIGLTAVAFAILQRWRFKTREFRSA